MSTEHHLVVPRTARYHQLGKPSAATRRVWFVYHGYGQLAAYFIRHFAAMAAADPGVVVVAPEGLSRFYLRGHSGRVGASWMTSDGRQHEIDDQVEFLNRLATHILGPCPAGVPVTVLGFSQGTATAGRWLVNAPFRPAHLVLWAGTFPPDTDPEATEQLVRDLPITLVVGGHDEYLVPALVAQQQVQLQQLGALLTVRTFIGGHALNQEIIAQLGRNETI